MKRIITWSFSAAVLIGLAAGIYFLTLSSLALAEEKSPAGVAAENPTNQAQPTAPTPEAAPALKPDPTGANTGGGCYRRFSGCSDQRGPGKAGQK
jgi:hypothetical protein